MSVLFLTTADSSACFTVGKGLSPGLKGTTSMALMHVTDLLPTLVAAAGGDPAAAAPVGMPLDGVSQWPHLSGTAASSAPPARADLLINIERDHPTTAPPAPGQTGCNGVGQYVVIKGSHKLIVGGGGLPNTWYHDGAPYHGADPTPDGGCLKACNATGCDAVPMIQVFDVLGDEAERNNLAADGANQALVAELMEVVRKYNQSLYVEALSNVVPVTTGCPFYTGPQQILTPCP